MRPLKIIYVFGHPLRIGGHLSSGLAMVRNLEAMGHHIIVLAPGRAEGMVHEFTGTGAEFFSIGELKRYPRLPSTIGTLRILQIAKERSPDIIHAQDYQCIGQAYLAAVLSREAFLLTQAGGNLTYQVPPMQADTVVFSQEQMENLSAAYRLAEGNLHLVRARIDRSVYRPENVDPAFIRKYGLPESGKKIVMAMRLASDKKSWLKTILETAETFSTNETGVWIVIAGEGPLMHDLQEKAAQVNKEKGDRQVLYFIGPILGSEEINQFYNYADVVVGNGRGILEAMACKKPVVVLGEDGEGEVVRPENIDEIAYFNFSGRHFRSRSKSAAALSTVLENLLADENVQQQLGDYCYEYISAHMDARVGAEQLVEIYKKALDKRSSLVDYAAWCVRAIFNRIVLALRRRLSFR